MKIISQARCTGNDFGSEYNAVVINIPDDLVSRIKNYHAMISNASWEVRCIEIWADVTLVDSNIDEIESPDDFIINDEARTDLDTLVISPNGDLWVTTVLKHCGLEGTHESEPFSISDLDKEVLFL